MPGLLYFYAARCKQLLPIRGRVGLVGLVMALAVAAWLLAASLPVQAVANTTATSVYGQGGSFTSNSDNNGGISATSLSNPNNIAVDPNGGIYIADNNNSRILHYSGTSATADRVYGQLGSFTSRTPNNGGLSADSLAFPSGVAVDGSGGVYVADFFNNRVLHYSGNNTTADRVYGQLGSFTSNTDNKGGVSATSLSTPAEIVVDGSGGLYIADYNNNRVLHYSGNSTTADRVYGQGGSFTSRTLNNGGLSANSLSIPVAVAVDPGGGLYVVDSGNSRVLHYSGNSTTADRVYGQKGSFTSNNINNGGISADSLYYPNGVATDGSGGVYVADYNNNRVLHYSGANTTADRVYGQQDSFTSGTLNNGGISADSLYGPTGVAVNHNGGLYVADYSNNRVLYYGFFALPASISASAGSGQSTTVATAFATRLVAKVVNSGNNPVSSVVVTFTAPSNGASGTFAGGSAVYTGTTDASGQVTTTAFTANSLAGTYSVTATVGGVNTPATFTLTNVAACNPLMVTSNLDNGSCGTLRYAVLSIHPPLTSKPRIITIDLPTGSVITLTTGLILTRGVSITTTAPCGVGAGKTMLPPITIQGVGSSSGNGLTLSGNNRLYGLWVRGFSGVQIKAPHGSSTLMQCVRASKL